MRQKVTEQLHDEAIGLDDRPLLEVAFSLVSAQIVAASAVKASIVALEAASSVMADTISHGGVLHYVAAGSSGLIAMADAMELGGTFSIKPDQVRIHMAGGFPKDAHMPGGTEDEVFEVKEVLSRLNPYDTVIAVSASGETPYTLAAAEVGALKKANIIGVANNKGSSLLRLAGFPVLLETPPELISGSTRLGAATAQKIALNTLSTLMAMRLGHIHDGMMVNLHADNIKLRDRAARIVAQIADVSIDHAVDALGKADGEVKTAIITAARGLSVDDARALLLEVGGYIRAALARSK